MRQNMSHPPNKAMAQELGRFRSPGFSGFAVAWSPFHPRQLALASSANFGLVGSGKLCVLHVGGPQIPVSLQSSSEWLTQDALYGLAWSEAHDRQIATASGDGSIKLWDIGARNGLPVARWKEHSAEVHSLDWSNMQKSFFLSASADATLKLWSPERNTSLQTVISPGGCAYTARFHPREPQLAASSHVDGSVLLHDLRAPQKPVLGFKAHDAETLSLDWNKYQPMTLASSSVDRTIRIHDLRAPLAARTTASTATKSATSQSLMLLGHQFPVRHITWSPHSAQVLASTSYDMTARIWAVSESGGTEVQRHEGHSEFVVGAAWSLFEPGALATCSWDQEVHLLKATF